VASNRVEETVQRVANVIVECRHATRIIRRSLSC
jgi:hypothetical protein